MKSTFKKIYQRLSTAMPINHPANMRRLYAILILLLVLGVSCTKEQGIEAPASEAPTVAVEQRNVAVHYPGLSPVTLWELQQARAATASYRQIKNAMKDGYKDINVVLPGMGHHFMKESLLDGTFDFKNPEILVYNKYPDGSYELVAVEYAVPISLLPNTPPAGFTGAWDEWAKNEGFGLWLVHAWVWAENPLGVFHPTNPLIHLH